MKPRTAIHLLGDHVVRTDLAMDDVLGAFTTAARGVGIIQLEAVKDHGERRRAYVPLSAVVWFEELS